MSEADAAQAVAAHFGNVQPIRQEIVDVTAVRESMPLLEDLCNKKIDAAAEFTESCKAVSEQAHINATVLAQYVNAVVKDKLEEHQQNVEQMQLLLEDPVIVDARVKTP